MNNCTSIVNWYRCKQRYNIQRNHDTIVVFVFTSIPINYDLSVLTFDFVCVLALLTKEILLMTLLTKLENKYESTKTESKTDFLADLFR